MILGVGVDIVQIGRIDHALAKFGNQFVQRVFGESERIYPGEKGGPAAYYAARFAAKEAFLKALGLGLRKGIRWSEIEVVTEPEGRPRLELKGRAKEICDQKGIKEIFVSLAHEKDYAVAVVVLEA